MCIFSRTTTLRYRLRKYRLLHPDCTIHDLWCISYRNTRLKCNVGVEENALLYLMFLREQKYPYVSSNTSIQRLEWRSFSF